MYYDTSSFIRSEFSPILFFFLVFLIRYLFVDCGGLVFLFFVAPSLVVFRSASAFNQDLSKWNTGAVTTMLGSKCTPLSLLSLSLWPRLPFHCVFWMRQFEFYLITILVTILTRSVIFCLFLERGPFYIYGLSWNTSHTLTPSLIAVFYLASAFNQNVSEWNTGAVTNMWGSKCHLFSFLWPRLPLLGFWIYTTIRVLEFHLITKFSHVCCTAVFHGASAFNQDVSKWNTGAVTTMASSKYNSSLWPRLPLLGSWIRVSSDHKILTLVLVHPPLLQCSI